MKYRRLGKSALQISTLCLGTMNFGSRTPEADAKAILNEAVEVGINFIDTANQYGGDLGVGTSESIIGKWFAEDASRRDRIVLATKVHEPMSDEVNDRGLSARHIQMACDASLKRLGVDHIDLYQMHHIDRTAHIDEVWQAMDRLIAQGKIIYVGSSNFPGWEIARASERAAFRRSLGLISEQSLYNLLERRVELEVLPACRAFGVGLIPWSPLAGGVLAGRARSTMGRRASEAAEQTFLRRADQLNAWTELCQGLGHSSSSVALAWLLSQTGVSATIIGPATVEQLKMSLDVPNIELSIETLDKIDVIFPPCGPAPEAYAW